jgi:hypothetical protein
MVLEKNIGVSNHLLLTSACQMGGTGSSAPDLLAPDSLRFAKYQE